MGQVARDYTGETVTAAVLGAVGGSLAGPAGAAIGTRAGVIAAARIDWSFKQTPAAENQVKPKRKRGKRDGKKENGPEPP
ncbi:hypothetical protein ELQ36_09100 [Methylococcus capsulatus]|nr:hypothetical protein [Methylococcus capsulatus]